MKYGLVTLIFGIIIHFIVSLFASVSRAADTVAQTAASSAGAALGYSAAIEAVHFGKGYLAQFALSSPHVSGSGSSESLVATGGRSALKLLEWSWILEKVGRLGIMLF